MPFKFENLEVWQLSMEHIDLIYELAEKLPRNEDFNLKSQITRAATSIALNIAEGSTGQTNPEFGRFLGIALRSNIEVVSCLYLAQRRGYIAKDRFEKIYSMCEEILVMINSLRKSLK